MAPTQMKTQARDGLVRPSVAVPHDRTCCQHSLQMVFHTISPRVTLAVYLWGPVLRVYCVQLVSVRSASWIGERYSRLANVIRNAVMGMQ
jgi:hypothetical protein